MSKETDELEEERSTFRIANWASLLSALGVVLKAVYSFIRKKR
jgi:hypothetical protein